MAHGEGEGITYTPDIRMGKERKGGERVSELYSEKEEKGKGRVELKGGMKKEKRGALFLEVTGEKKQQRHQGNERQ